MAVIVKDMDVPDNCRDCERRSQCPNWNRKDGYKEEWQIRRADDCPLKSVEGLMDKLEANCQITVGSDNAPAVTLYDAERIIKEYCCIGE